MSDVTVKYGSREWAVIQLMRGHEVVNEHSKVGHIYDAKSITLSEYADGWELYSEPEPEIPRGMPVRGECGIMWYYIEYFDGRHWLSGRADTTVRSCSTTKRPTILSVLDWHYKPELPPESDEDYPALWNDGKMAMVSDENIAKFEHVVAWSPVPYLPPVTP